MTPEHVLTEITIFKNIVLHRVLKDFILSNKEFNEAAINIENFPIESVLRCIKVLEKSMGGCPHCGGRTVWRRGVYFDNEKRCVICHWTGVPK